MHSAPAKRLALALRATTANGKPEAVVALARAAGVDGRLGRRAATGQPVNADAYLKLSAACGADPLTGAPCAKRTLPDLDRNRVAIKILMALIEGASLRSLAAQWDVEYSAINRAKHHKPVGVENFLKICVGLGRHPHDFLTRTPMFHGEQAVQQQPEAVA